MNLAPRRLLLAATVALLLSASTSAQAAVTILVDQIQGAVPDADALLLGDSDPYVRVFIEGNFVGASSVLDETNNPNWGGQTFSFSAPLDPQVTPVVVIVIEIYDEDSGSDDLLGIVSYGYDWTGGVAEVQNQGFTGPDGSGQLSARFRTILDPVATESPSWSETKARYGH